MMNVENVEISNVFYGAENLVNPQPFNIFHFENCENIMFKNVAIYDIYPTNVLRDFP